MATTGWPSGTYDAIREAGLKIPDDLAVVGFDNRAEVANHMQPRLTTVALPYRQMGARAVEILANAEPVTATATELIACPLIEAIIRLTGLSVL